MREKKTNTKREKKRKKSTKQFREREIKKHKHTNKRQTRDDSEIITTTKTSVTMRHQRTETNACSGRRKGARGTGLGLGLDDDDDTKIGRGMRQAKRTSSLRLETSRTAPLLDCDMRNAAGPSADAVDPGRVNPAGDWKPNNETQRPSGLYTILQALFTKM